MSSGYYSYNGMQPCAVIAMCVGPLQMLKGVTSMSLCICWVVA